VKKYVHVGSTVHSDHPPSPHASLIRLQVPRTPMMISAMPAGNRATPPDDVQHEDECVRLRSAEGEPAFAACRGNHHVKQRRPGEEDKEPGDDQIAAACASSLVPQRRRGSQVDDHAR
jgi:hypothetical protein